MFYPILLKLAQMNPTTNEENPMASLDSANPLIWLQLDSCNSLYLHNDICYKICKISASRAIHAF